MNALSLTPESLATLSIEEIAHRLKRFLAAQDSPNWSEVSAAEEERETAHKLFLEADARYQRALAAIHGAFGSGPFDFRGGPVSIVQRPSSKGVTYFLRRLGVAAVTRLDGSGKRTIL